jgi:protoheme IX farnesyltransferase
MIGWAAATGGIGIEPIVLFLIIFFWTPPHFWALALLRADEYSRAGVPMLPVTAGRAETRRQILIYSLLLVPLGVAPALMGFAGLTYGGIAVAAGAVFVALALRLHRIGDGAGTDAAAKALFGYSILYLFVLFAAMLIENRVHAMFGIAGA